jgi:hypothetical protein
MKHHERFVIMQNHTVALVDRGPHELMELLERLIGTYPLRTAIEQQVLLVRRLSLSI